MLNFRNAFRSLSDKAFGLVSTALGHPPIRKVEGFIAQPGTDRVEYRDARGEVGFTDYGKAVCANGRPPSAESIRAGLSMIRDRSNRGIRLVGNDQFLRDVARSAYEMGCAHRLRGVSPAVMQEAKEYCQRQRWSASLEKSQGEANKAADVFNAEKTRLAEVSVPAPRLQDSPQKQLPTPVPAPIQAQETKQPKAEAKVVEQTKAAAVPKTAQQQWVEAVSKCQDSTRAIDAYYLKAGTNAPTPELERLRKIDTAVRKEANGAYLKMNQERKETAKQEKTQVQTKSVTPPEVKPERAPEHQQAQSPATKPTPTETEEQNSISAALPEPGSVKPGLVSLNQFAGFEGKYLSHDGTVYNDKHGSAWAIESGMDFRGSSAAQRDPGTYDRQLALAGGRFENGKHVPKSQLDKEHIDWKTRQSEKQQMKTGEPKPSTPQSLGSKQKPAQAVQGRPLPPPPPEKQAQQQQTVQRAAARPAMPSQSMTFKR